MEIKTLAQILAESESDSAKSFADKKSASDSKPLSKKTFTKKTSSNNSSSGKTSYNHPTANKQPSTKARFSNEDNTELKERAAFKKRSASKNDRSPDDETYTPPSSLDDHDPYLGSQVSDESLLSGAGKRKPRANRKNRFHSAANYQPTNLKGEIIAELAPLDPTLADEFSIKSQEPSPALTDDLTTVDEPTIQSILAELKKEASEPNQQSETAPMASDSTQEANAKQEANSQLIESNDADDSLEDPNNHLENPNSPDGSDNSNDIDNLPSALKVYLLTPEQRHARKEAIKAESRLRWLAFYYLSRREHARGELRQKLLDKDQDPQKVEALLDEFAEKGYQSDWRTAMMLIREGMRKGRGRERIRQDFYKRKLEVPSNIDELIDMASSESDEFADFIDEDAPEEGVDWLRLAVEARVRKYGAELPESQKEKARQLRFLQYRGFKSGICFEALKYDLDTLEERDY